MNNTNMSSNVSELGKKSVMLNEIFNELSSKSDNQKKVAKSNLK
jgi:hypothetical protein